MIESHDRPGGDRINELVRVAYDVDLKAIALGGPSGLVPVLQSAPPLRGGAAIRFFTPAPGLVHDIRGLPEVESAVGVVELHLGIRPGGRVRPITESYDRVGWVMCQAESVQLAIARCEDVLR